VAINYFAVNYLNKFSENQLRAVYKQKQYRQYKAIRRSDRWKKSPPEAEIIFATIQ